MNLQSLNRDWRFGLSFPAQGRVQLLPSGDGRWMQADFFQPGGELGAIFQSQGDFKVARFVIVMLFFVGIRKRNFGTL